MTTSEYILSAVLLIACFIVSYLFYRREEFREREKRIRNASREEAWKIENDNLRRTK